MKDRHAKHVTERLADLAEKSTTTDGERELALSYIQGIRQLKKEGRHAQLGRLLNAIETHVLPKEGGAA